MNLRRIHPRHRPWLTGGAIVAVTAIVLALPVPVPYTITAPGKILCANEWVVALNRDGGIAAFVADRVSGVTRQYSLAQFNRGDAVSFSIDPRIITGTSVSAGDTVGVARSSEVERELERLRGELRNAIASLAVTATGEKAAVVEEAAQTVEHAKRQAEDLDAVYARQKMLFEKGLVSEQEFDLAKRRASTAQIEVSIAEARLRSVTTGAKKEQTEFVRSQILSLQNEIRALERHEQGFRLISPVSGIITQMGGSDTLLVVSDTTSYVVVMPVPVHERGSVVADQQVTLRASEVSGIPAASVLKVDRTIQSLNGQQVVFATARMHQAPAEVLNGLLARCTIECASLTPWEYAGRKFRSLVR